MTKLTQGTPVVAPLIPGMDSSNSWPTHFAEFGAGGFQVVDSVAERDAVSPQRRINKAILVRNDNGQYAIYEYSNSQWNLVTLSNGGIRIIDKDGTNTSGVTDLKFMDAILTNGSSGESILTMDHAVAGGITVVDGFDQSANITRLKVLGSLLKQDGEGNQTLEIADGVSITGEDGIEIDGVKLLAFPEFETSHDNNTGNTVLTLKNHGLKVRGSQGNAIDNVIDIMFKRAEVIVDTKTGRAYVDTKTGVDVDVDNQVFHGVERINFNNCKAVQVHDDGSLYITPDPLTIIDETPTESDEQQSSSFKGEARKVATRPPLRSYPSVDEKDKVALDIDPNAFEKQRPDSFLGYLTYPAQLVSGGSEDSRSRGYMWPDEVVYSPSRFITLNSDSHTISISKDSESALINDYYFFGFKVNIPMPVTSDATVSIGFADANNRDLYLKAFDGDSVLKQVSVKAGDTPNDIYLYGVLPISGDTEFIPQVSSTGGDLTIAGKATGLSGIVLQRLTSNETTSPALLQWASDLGVSPIITRYDMKEAFLTMPDIATFKDMGFKDGGTHPASQHLKTIDGWNLYSTDAFVSKWDSDGFLFLDNTPWMYFGAIIDSVRTKFLANDGQNAVVKAKLKPYFPGYWLVAATWAGDPDKATFPITTGYDKNKHLIYSVGWTQLHAIPITATGNLTSVEVNETVTVPFDAENIAFFFVPQESAGTSDMGVGVQFGIRDMTVSPANEDLHFKIENMENDRPGYKSFSGIVDETSGSGGGITLGTTPTHVGFGVAGLTLVEDGSANVTRDISKVAMRFGESGEVIVTFAAQISVKQNISGLTYTNNKPGNVRFYAELFDSADKSKGIITASKRLLWLPDHHAPITPEINFPATVEKGDYICFLLATDIKDVVELKYMPGVPGDLDLALVQSFTYLGKPRRFMPVITSTDIVNPMRD